MASEGQMKKVVLAGLLIAQVGACSLSASAHGLAGRIMPKSDLLASTNSESVRAASVFEMPESLSEGQKLLAAGQAPKAAALFQQYVKENDSDGEGYFWLGTALNEIGDAKGSVEAFGQAVTLNSRTGADSAQLRVNFGNSLMVLDRTDEALFQYHKALAIDPNEARAYFNLARAQIKKESPVTAQAALLNLQKASALGLSHPDIYRYSAMSYIILSENDKAAKELKLYLQHVPNDKADLSLRKTIEETISELVASKEEDAVEHELVPIQKRRYTLTTEIAYAVLDLDETNKIVTIGAEDSRDPDDGAQDGKNDGIFQMSSIGFNTQVSIHPKLVGLGKKVE
ncbi:MAG: tetratricopeptide repeat protein [Candidatus Obscuribacterales bacterium]|nr:tetratricopeptide repeat protein [Candidatus Obscuribacterales bacterium]